MLRNAEKKSSTARKHWKDCKKIKRNFVVWHKNAINMDEIEKLWNEIGNFKKEKWRRCDRKNQLKIYDNFLMMC